MHRFRQDKDKQHEEAHALHSRLSTRNDFHIQNKFRFREVYQTVIHPVLAATSSCERKSIHSTLIRLLDINTDGLIMAR